MSEHPAGDQTAAPRARRTTGVALIEALRAEGVDTVFGIPGTHNIELYRGLELTGTIRHISPRHEQGAAYAADGYTRSSGRPGVIITTSGPGLTNAITGIANAYADSVPMLIISPGIQSGLERSDIGSLHELKDQRGALDGIAQRSIRPATPAQAVAAVHETFARWRTERGRPVFLEIPLDVLEAETDVDAGTSWPAPWPPAPPTAAVVELAAALAGSTSPLIIAGGGSVDAAAALTAFAERIDAPVLTTTLGKGVIDESHGLSVGEFANAGSSAPIIHSSDLVFAIGTELSNPGLWQGFPGRLVRVDVDPAQLHKNVVAETAVQSDAATFLTALLAELGPSACMASAPAAAAEPVSEPAPERGGRARAAESRAASLAAMPSFTEPWRRIQDALQNALPTGTIVAGDSSQVSYLGTGPFWRFAEPRHYVVTTGYSTLGYALPAAIGAKLANPDRPVLALLGDGAAMFSIQELLTAAEEGLGIAVVIADNHGYEEIRLNMLDAGVTPMAVGLKQPDFVALAQAMGSAARRVHSLDELAEQTALAVAGSGPTLIVLDVCDAK